MSGCSISNKTLSGGAAATTTTPQKPCLRSLASTKRLALALDALPNEGHIVVAKPRSSSSRFKLAVDGVDAGQDSVRQPNEEGIRCECFMSSNSVGRKRSIPAVRKKAPTIIRPATFDSNVAPPFTWVLRGNRVCGSVALSKSSA